MHSSEKLDAARPDQKDSQTPSSWSSEVPEIAKLSEVEMAPMRS